MCRILNFTVYKIHGSLAYYLIYKIYYSISYLTSALLGQPLVTLASGISCITKNFYG